jgi:hypothetical protein
MMLRCVLVALVVFQAEELKLAPVPAQVRASVKQALQDRRDDLEARWAAYLKKKADFQSEFKGIKKDDPRIVMVQKRMAAIKLEGDNVVDDADAYNEKVQFLLGHSAIDARIAELEVTLKGEELRKALQKELDEMSRRLEATRENIKTSAVRLKGYPEAIEEWSALNDKAVKEAYVAAADATLTLFLEKKAMKNEAAIEADLDVLSRIAKEYRSVFAGKAVAPVVAENLAHLETWKQVWMVASATKDAAFAVHELHDREKYLSVILKTIAMANQVTFRDPRISLLISDGELVIADVYLVAAKATAHARINQILEVEAGELKGLTSLTRHYKADIDRRNRLRARIAEIE